MNNPNAPTKTEMAEHLLNECIDRGPHATNRDIFNLAINAARHLGGYDAEGAAVPEGPDIPRATEFLRTAAPMTLEPVPPVVVRKGKDQEGRQRSEQFSAELDRARLRLEVHAVLCLLEQGSPAPAHPDVKKLAAAADAAETFARALRAATGA